MLYNIINNK